MFIRRALPMLLLVGLAVLGAGRRAAAKPRCDLAITHVSVVPMSSETILRDRTVRVQGGRIAAIVKAGSPSDGRCTQEIDGGGRYLAPGLNDLHVHLPSLAFGQAFGVKDPPATDFPAALAPYLAAGVTGLRVMSGASDILAFRDSQRGRASAFPRLVVATPMFSGARPVIPEPVTKVVTTPEAARRAVEAFADAGYDFIKVRDNLQPPVLRAIVETGAKRGLYVDGHISQGQGLAVADVLHMGQKAVAHLDNFALDMKTADADPAPYVKLMLACGCFVSTTLQVETNAILQLRDYDRMIGRKGVNYLDPTLVKLFWAKPNNGYIASKADPAFFAGLYDRDKALLRAFVAAGVPVVAGTDALNPMILPGESLHDELEAMVEAGLTPYQALRAATAAPRAHVPGFAEVGVIAPGAVANAVLVDADPLVDLKTLRAPIGVMINGHWLTAADLARGLDRAAAVAAGR